MPSVRGRLRFLPWVPALILASSLALADVKPSDSAAARDLFDQAKELAGQKKYDQACPKFEESQRLDPGAGTLFHLADCYEQVGRTASAWALFLEVASQSAGAKRSERESAARDRAASLRPRLAQITIVVDSSSAADDLHVSRDGTEVGKAVWGTAVPVDPGKHAIEAKAPGRKTFTTEVDVPTGPNNVEVKIPVMDPQPASGAAPDKPAPVQAGPGSGRRMIGLVVGGAGVLAFGASVVVAAHAKSKFNDSSSHCNGSACDQEGADLRHSAVGEGNIASVVGGIGLAALAAGTILFITAPRSKPREPSVALAFSPSGVLVQGAW
jgi:hypothetical protein